MSEKELKEIKETIVRPPVVVVLGHVDHGKSSILEAIKNLRITAKESGGITQHIGAYEIEENGKKITFIDTPGHEAFSAMRSRGAKVADIAILVVAAEEGIKPQTEEAILKIKEAGLSPIVAINKIDKPEADPERVKRELAKKEMVVESMGGKVPSVNVSAKTGEGIQELLEIISLISEMEDLKGDLSKKGEGTVIESYLDANRGPTATILLRDGVLKVGEIIGTPSSFGKIKIMENFEGKPVKKAFPSMPVVVIGFGMVPGVGEKFKVYQSLEEAENEIIKEEKKNQGQNIEVLDIKEGQEVVNLILKTDVVGSLGAIEEVLKSLPQEKVFLRILKAEVGNVSESDIKLAIGAKAKIVGFRVKINPIAKSLAERKKITVMNFEVIYELAQAVRNLLAKKVGQETVRIDLGKVKVLQIFRNEKSRQIIGGRVIDGEIKVPSFVEIFRLSLQTREEEKIGQGKIIGLQRDKKKVTEIGKGFECGILFQGETKIEEDDILNFYIEEKQKGEL